MGNRASVPEIGTKMNEMREVSRAYYARASAEERELAQQFFRSLDANADGRVSLQEYKKVACPGLSSDQFFAQLDQNGDGTLDFDEVLALFYMHKVPITRCRACYDLLLDSYFTCLLCEKNHPSSYELCCNCYGGGRFEHQHSKFLDNRALRILLAQFLKHAEVEQPDQNVKRDIQAQTVARVQSELAKQVDIKKPDQNVVGDGQVPNMMQQTAQPPPNLENARIILLALGTAANIGLQVAGLAVGAACCIM